VGLTTDLTASISDGLSERPKPGRSGVKQAIARLHERRQRPL
jgi:hypothetical protein